MNRPRIRRLAAWAHKVSQRADHATIGLPAATTRVAGPGRAQRGVDRWLDFGQVGNTTTAAAVSGVHQLFTTATQGGAERPVGQPAA